MRLLLAVLCLAVAAPAFAQTDPNPVTTVIVVPPSPPLADWTFKVAGLTVIPSASVTPDLFSFKDLSFSTGPNAGVGVDVLWPNGYGVSPHVGIRDTSVGTKPLASLFAVLPPISQFGIRPGILYQFNGGVAPWRDGFMFGIAGAANITAFLHK